MSSKQFLNCMLIPIALAPQYQPNSSGITTIRQNESSRHSQKAVLPTAPAYCLLILRVCHLIRLDEPVELFTT